MVHRIRVSGGAIGGGIGDLPDMQGCGDDPARNSETVSDHARLDVVQAALAHIRSERKRRGCTCPSDGTRLRRFDPECPAMQWHVGCCLMRQPRTP